MAGAQNPFGHVDLRVPDLEAGVAFYGALLPEIGFPQYLGGKLFRCWAPEGAEGPAGPWFGITEDKQHRPNGNRIAFWAESREAVDRAATAAMAAGSREVSGPKEMLEYSNNYYAVFFEDPWGNALEVLHYIGSA